MKFCKQLHRVMDISDPEWAPYYTDYKMLKKLLKEMQHSPTTTTELPTAHMPPPSLPQERPELIHLADTESEDDDDVKESSQVNTMKKTKTTMKNTGSNCNNIMDANTHAPTNHQKSLPLSHKETTLGTGRTAFVTTHDDDSGGGGAVPSSPPPPPPIVKPKGTEMERVMDSVITIDRQLEQNEETLRNDTSNEEDTLKERSPLHKKQCCKTSPPSMAERATVVQKVIRDYQQQEQPRCRSTATHPILFHQEIRYNDQEQYFFRCLHLEVKKVTFFYQTMVQDLYIRYEQICQSIVQVLHIRPATTNTTLASTATIPIMTSQKKATRASRMGAMHRKDGPTIHDIRSEFEYGVHRLLSQPQRVSKDDDIAHRQSPPLDQNNDIPVALLLKIYKLSRDLLLLETYSVMALTAFSKILKKHDKVTGYNTKYAFMTKIVIPSNFVQTREQPFDNDHHQRYRCRHHRRQPFPPSAVGPRVQLGASRLPRFPEDPESHSNAASATTVAKQKLMATTTTTTTSTASTAAVELIPSLRTMIDQCYYWYSVLSERFEMIQTQQEELAQRQQQHQQQQQLLQRKELLKQLQERQQLQQILLQQQQQQQQRQPPPSLQYDEFLFLHMVNQFQR